MTSAKLCPPPPGKRMFQYIIHTPLKRSLMNLKQGITVQQVRYSKEKQSRVDTKKETRQLSKHKQGNTVPTRYTKKRQANKQTIMCRVAVFNNFTNK